VTRRNEGSAPDMIVVGDASDGTLAVPTFASRWGVTGGLDPQDGSPVIGRKDQFHLDHHVIRVHDLQQKTPAGVPDRRLSWQLANPYDAPYESSTPEESVYSQAEEITARNRGTRVADGDKVAVLASLERNVGSEDGRYARSLTLNEIELEAPETPPESPQGGPPADLPPPPGVAFRDASVTGGPASNVRQSEPSVAVGGVTHFGQAYVDAAREIINAGGNAGDISRALLADKRGQPRPPLEGKLLPPIPEDLPETQERETEEPRAGIAAQNKPAGYVSSADRTAMLGTLLTTYGEVVHVATKDGRAICVLCIRWDGHLAIDHDRRGPLAIKDEDAAAIPDASGMLVKGWLQPDSGLADPAAVLPGERFRIRPVIRVPKPDPVIIGPKLPPPEVGGSGCGVVPRGKDEPPEAKPEPRAEDAVASAENAQRVADAAADVARQRADSASAAAERSKADPNAPAGQGSNLERDAAAAAANAQRSARTAQRAAELAHEALDAARAKQGAAERAQDARNASRKDGTAAVATQRERQADAGAALAARRAESAAWRAQRAAERASAANVRASRAEVKAKLQQQQRLEREAREAKSKAARAQRDIDRAKTPEERAAAVEAKRAADERERDADLAALRARDALKEAREKLEAAKADAVKDDAPDEPPGARDEEQAAKDDQEDNDAIGVSEAIGLCDAKKEQEDILADPWTSHPLPDGSKWVEVHEADNSLTKSKLPPPGGDPRLGGTNLQPDGTLTSIGSNGETQTSISTGVGLPELAASVAATKAVALDQTLVYKDATTGHISRVDPDGDVVDLEATGGGGGSGMAGGSPGEYAESSYVSGSITILDIEWGAWGRSRIDTAFNMRTGPDTTASGGRTFTFANSEAGGAGSASAFGGVGTLTASSGNFTTDGWTRGMGIGITGTTNNNTEVGIVTNVAATVLTIMRPGALVVGEGPLSATARIRASNTPFLSRDDFSRYRHSYVFSINLEETSQRPTIRWDDGVYLPPGFSGFDTGISIDVMTRGHSGAAGAAYAWGDQSVEYEFFVYNPTDGSTEIAVSRTVEANDTDYVTLTIDAADLTAFQAGDLIRGGFRVVDAYWGDASIYYVENRITNLRYA
jgi:hypothetical protein